MTFLIDVNLPKLFSFFNAPNFHHLADIEPTMTDADAWSLARENDWVILTKDVDYYHRSMSAKQRVKVVHFRLGNMTLRDLYAYFQNYWSDIVLALQTYDLVVAYRDRIDCIL